ncbi:hypothetical protein H8959_016762 [Pygathrix nigripes]
MVLNPQDSSGPIEAHRHQAHRHSLDTWELPPSCGARRGVLPRVPVRGGDGAGAGCQGPRVGAGARGLAPWSRGLEGGWAPLPPGPGQRVGKAVPPVPVVPVCWLLLLGVRRVRRRGGDLRPPGALSECARENRRAAGGANVWAEAATPTTQPHSHALGDLWLRATWDKLLSSRSPSLPAGSPQTQALGAPLCPTAGGWRGLAPKLARPAQPPRRLLPALEALLSCLERRRAQPSARLLTCPGPRRELSAPASPGRPRGLGRAAPGDWTRWWRPGGRGDSTQRAPLDAVPQRRPGPPHSSSCLASLPLIWEVLWIFFLLLQPWRRPRLRRHSWGPEAADHGAGQPPLKSAKPSLA